MAAPTTVSGSKLIIEVGDGASPEVFDAPCALTTKGLNFTGTPNEQSVPDCDDPDAPMWIARTIQTLSAEISGSGILALESYDVWRDWFMSAVKKTVRFRLDVPAPDGGYYQGFFVLTGFNSTGNQGEVATIEVTMQSDGPVDWTAGAVG